MVMILSYRQIVSAPSVVHSRIELEGGGELKWVVNSKRTDIFPSGSGCRVNDSPNESVGAADPCLLATSNNKGDSHQRVIREVGYG